MPEATESQSAFSRRVGVSRQAINAMLSRGLPSDASGRVKIEAGLKWLRENVESAATRQGDRDGLLEVRRELLLRRIAICELEIAERGGRLVDKSAAERGINTFIRMMRDAWMNFPNRFGAQIAADIGSDPKVTMAALDRFIRDQLTEIANLDPPKELTGAGGAG